MGVRRNQACLSAPEKAAFVGAVKALKATGAYELFVLQHLNAFLAPTFGLPDPAHGGPAFLPWHREFLRRFEIALQAINPSVTIPYWDWTSDKTPAASLWSPSFMGGDGDGPGSRVTTGPFAFSTGEWTLTVRDPGDPDPFLKRSLGADGHLPSVDEVRAALRVTPYDSPNWNRVSAGFRGSVERAPIHNSAHVWVGGSMMAMTSPNDPAFWLHHCSIDRLWAIWQEDHPNDYLPLSGTAGAPAGHALDDPMPPWSAEPTPPTPRRVLDHRALGYSYDSYSLLGDVVGAEGKVTLLRAHDRGTKYGPPLDQIDVEAVAWLDSEPGRAFGFQLRDDANEGAHLGMLNLLRSSFNRGHRIRIDYIPSGSCNGRILRVMKTP